MEITWTTAFSNSMKLSFAMWGHPGWTDYAGEVWQNVVWQNVVHWEGNGKPLQYSRVEKPTNSMKRENDKMETERGTPQVSRCPICYWVSWRNNSRKNEEMEPKHRQYPAVDVTSDRSKVQCCKDKYCIRSDQIRSVAQLCPTLCDPMNCSTPGLPVHHQLTEFTQTHVHRVSDAIQPSHPLSSPSPPAPNPSQQQSIFQWVNSSHKVAKVLEFQL